MRSPSMKAVNVEIVRIRFIAILKWPETLKALKIATEPKAAKVISPLLEISSNTRSETDDTVKQHYRISCNHNHNLITLPPTTRLRLPNPPPRPQSLLLSLQSILSLRLPPSPPTPPSPNLFTSRLPLHLLRINPHLTRTQRQRARRDRPRVPPRLVQTSQELPHTAHRPDRRAAMVISAGNGCVCCCRIIRIGSFTQCAFQLVFEVREPEECAFEFGIGGGFAGGEGGGARLC
jgi:hypothetical protein